MAVTLNKANLVLKDANGNIGKIEQLSDRDLAKIRTAVSDVALVVNQSNHTPIEATTTNKGVVQLATSADVVSGASDKVVTAEQLHNASTGTSALATENLARIDAVVTEAGIPIDHTNTNQLKTAVTTLVNNAVPSTATSTTLGVVKPDNDTITIDSNGVLTATKATKDSAGNVIANTYVKKTGDETISGVKTFTGTVNANGFIGFNSTRAGTGSGFANYLNNNRVCDVWGQPKAGVDANISYIHLRVKDYGTDDNLAYLVIAGNNQTKQGSIAFNDKNLVRSVNGVNANVNGNVSLVAEDATTSNEAITINDNSSNNISLTTASEITVANGTTGKAWSKAVKITNSSSTITLGSSWTWKNGEVPTLSANSLLVLKWCYDYGIAGLVSITG